MFDNIAVWKLHSAQDYLSFFAVILGGAAVFWLVVRRLKRNRTDESARRRVAKRLRSLAGKNGRVYEEFSLALPQGTARFDGLLVDRRGVVLLRVYGWGTAVYGQLQDPTWKLMDSSDSKTIDNPLLAVERVVEPLQRRLAAAGIHGVPIRPLAVFADTYQKPRLYLGRTGEALPLAELKGWYKRRLLVKPMAPDPARVCEALTASRPAAVPE